MKSMILVVIAGALLAGCSFRSETTVQRPVAQPAAVVVANPPAGTVYVPR
jgi:putative hemolysin